MQAGRGFEEIAHAADWSIRVWAEDLASLFVEAAHGMSMLAGMQLASEPRVSWTFEHEATDHESLLVAFLSELLYLQEHDDLGFDHIQINLQDSSMKAELRGAAILSLGKAIKAVTFHNLHIIRTPRGYETEIVFDV